MKGMEQGHAGGHYRRLLLMGALSFVAMYALMYAMVNSFANVYANVNQAYMAALLTAPMVVLEVLVMSTMYPDHRKNAAIIVGGLVLLAGAFCLIQKQALVSDRQFLRSMIPHHASAILMCNEASLEDAEVKQLCERIVASQQSEIDLMKRKLHALDREGR